VPDPCYLPLGGDRFAPTEATAGPWDPRFQHGGPPVALLVRAMERCEPAPDTLLCRVAVEFLGPVPVAELAASARVLRGGRRVQLLAAELQRVAVAADSGSGVSWVLDWNRWSFVNVDLSIHLVRPPRREWVCLAASTHVEPEGVALASTVLYDEGGRIGTAAQSLLVEPR
jgi:acyl-coenzyme A thioesterase PaaI-like protein